MARRLSRSTARCAAAVFAALLATACSGSSKEARAICERAATKWEGCMAELLGPEMMQSVRAKRQQGVRECAADQKTIELYEACLPKGPCDEFLSCMQEHVAETP